MDKQIFSKILAVMLVITLTFANFMFLAVYAGKTYAAGINYEAQETKIDKTDISFDAYFVSDTGVKTHTKVTEMNNAELKLFLSASVTKGYLKDAVVSIENANFKVIESKELPNGVEVIDTQNNTITLKQINKGEKSEIVLPIEVIKDEQFDLNNFSKEAKVNLTGVFVNDAAKEIKVEKTILVNLSLSENAESHLEAIISKHVIFEEEGKKKELLQLEVNSNVIDNLLPVKTAEINIEVPQLHEIDPEYVSVVSTSTKATNGNDGTAFGKDNYTYENGIISLSVLNQADENNKVSWLKNETDKYIINLVYAIDEVEKTDNIENIENAEDTEVEKILLNITSKLSLYNNEEKIIENTLNQEIEIPEELNNVVSFAINNEANEIAKGYMLVKDAANTEYKQNIEVNIGYSPIVNNIEINKSREYYTDNNERDYIATTYYKKITISKENLTNILGEEGTIEIISGEEKIATLNAETIEYVFEDEISEIQMITSVPQTEGTLVVKTEKYIKSAEYDAKITSSLNKITTSIVGKSNLAEEQRLAEAALIEPTLQVKTSISNNKLSTVIENEDVELRVALQTNNNTNKLFKNPTIEIELPSYIKEVKIKNVNLLYNTELIATHGEILTNSRGNKVIVVKLEGEQTKFSDVVSVDGITLIIGTDLIVDKTTPSIIQKMNVKVTNNETEVVETSTDVEYVAPTGIITLNSISGYNSKNETVTSMSGTAEVGKLTINSEARVATQTMTIINNYDYTCEDIQILGRTPTQGNKDLSTDADLGSTFTAEMISTIKIVEGIEDKDITVYYSANIDATEDIADESNGWTTNIEELENVASYLIVLSNTMAKGDKISFSYDIQIPENLGREQSTYSVYKVNYTNMDGALQGAKETVKATVVGISTGEGAELELELTANVEEGTLVKQGDIIEYTLNVENIGKTVANNVKVVVDIPSWSYYAEKIFNQDTQEYEFSEDREKTEFVEIIESIEPGKYHEITFAISVGARVEYEEENFVSLNSTNVTISAKAVVTDDGEEFIFTSNEVNYDKADEYLELVLETEGTQYLPGNTQYYNLFVNKLGIEDRKNVKITFDVPEGIKMVSSTIDENNVQEEINGSKVTWTIEELNNSIIIRFEIEILEVSKDTEVKVQMVATCDGYNGEIKSNADIFTIGTPRIEISHSSTNTQGYLTEGEEISYILTIKNVGNADAYNVQITDYASKGLLLQNVKYSLGTSTIEYKISGQKAVITETIPGQETLIIEITAKAAQLAEKENTKTITNKFEVELENIEKMTSETITHTVNKKIYSLEDGKETVTTYSVAGLVWVDENTNGTRELDETILPEVPVLLLNETGNTIDSTITGVNGSYVFTGIKEGKYIVVFLYDMANYDVTSYKVGDVTSDNDAVTMNVTIDGIETKCAATNVISVLGNNVNNIDLGLKISPKFDLSLTKTISKVTVQTSKNTITNTYNNSTLEKVEIPEKELGNATVVIEYLITVRNDGAVAGYAKRVVDYLSATDLKFNSETNSDWYLGTDGNLYSPTLADTLLKPGESATLKLVLTKKVTENNTGLTNNTAEIYEASNDEAIEDFNSNPGNKASNENDLGHADIIIGPKTGVVLYIGIILTFMIVLTVGVYIINKKVINKV